MAGLSPGLGGAYGVGSFLQGAEQKRQDEEQQKLDAANIAATLAGTQATQEQTKEQSAAFQRSQANIGKNYGFDPKIFSRMQNPDERTRYIQTAQARAIAAGDTASANALGQMATAVPLGTERLNQGQYYGARADYEKWRPTYDRDILQYKYYSTDQATQTKIKEIAGRISVADIRRATGGTSGSNDTRLLLGALTYERMVQGQNETTARQEAMDEYNRNWSGFLANAKQMAGGGDPIPGLPTTAPQMPSMSVTQQMDPMEMALLAAIAKQLGLNPSQTQTQPHAGDGQPAPTGAVVGKVYKYKDGNNYIVGPDHKMYYTTEAPTPAPVKESGNIGNLNFNKVTGGG